METKKVRWLSTLQSLAILLVVIGHSYPAGANYPIFFAWLHNCIYCFHMPLFMVISGFLFYYHKGAGGSYNQFIIKKAKRLLMPYLIICSLAFLPKFALSQYALRPVELSLSWFIHNLVYPWDNVIVYFWFLPTLFIIFAISPALYRLCKVSTSWLAVISALIAVPYFFNPFSGIKFLNLEGVASYLIFFWTGCLLSLYWDSIKSRLNKSAALGLFLLTTVALNLIPYNHPGLNFLMAMAGIGLSISFSLMYDRNNWSFIDPLNGYSFQIFLLSWFPQMFFFVLAYKILGLGFYLTAVLMLTSGLIIPIILARLLQNTRCKIVIGM